jgi:hypothetical protein
MDLNQSRLLDLSQFDFPQMSKLVNRRDRFTNGA